MTELIAELSSSWGGKRDWLRRLVENVAAAGFDRAKVQSWQTKTLRADDPQLAWFKQSEMTDKDHEVFLTLCHKHGVKPLTTVYHANRVPFLAGLGLDAIKVGSGEAMEESLLHAVAEHPWKVYVSTGLMTVADIERANFILAHREVVFLHCVTQYPTPANRVNLGRIHWLAHKTLRPCGYSDHAHTNAAAMAAIAMGARCVEVHHSVEGAPRCREWDKGTESLRELATFRDVVMAMKNPHPMAWPVSEPRPLMGRWQHGV